MREYFYTESTRFSYLNGQEIVSKEIPNEATLELYGQEVYEITFESGYSMIAYADEIRSEYELKADKITDHIQMIEFTQLLGPYELAKVVLFNDLKIDEAAVKELIAKGKAECSESVVVISKQQYESLCGR